MYFYLIIIIVTSSLDGIKTEREYIGLYVREKKGCKDWENERYGR